MTTPLQMQSNARNAQHSTGPTSAEGKARVARNALKHGFCAADAVMPGEDAGAFDALLQRKRAHWQPRDEKEAELVEEIAVAYWRRWRLRRAEAELWAVRCAAPAHAGDDPAAQDARGLLSLGEAIANDCDTTANAIEKLRRWWQGNERHLNRCEEQLLLRRRLAAAGVLRRDREVDASGVSRFLHAAIDRPLPGETAATAPDRSRECAEQTQCVSPESDQPAGVDLATPGPDASDSVSVAPPALLHPPQSRAERRRLLREQRKAQRREARG